MFETQKQLKIIKTKNNLECYLQITWNLYELTLSIVVVIQHFVAIDRYKHVSYIDLHIRTYMPNEKRKAVHA